MKFIDYYKILGIDKKATESDIKKAYRKLSKQFHPDVNPEGAERFKEITEAYDTVGTESKRLDYDNKKNNPFGSMFGGSGGGGTGGKRSVSNATAGTVNTGGGGGGAGGGPTTVGGAGVLLPPPPPPPQALRLKALTQTAAASSLARAREVESKSAVVDTESPNEWLALEPSGDYAERWGAATPNAAVSAVAPAAADQAAAASTGGAELRIR